MTNSHEIFNSESKNARVNAAIPSKIKFSFDVMIDPTRKRIKPITKRNVEIILFS